MNVARFIARRYFKAKKSRNVINLITNISVVGIAITTAALVILLSAFNGIENLVIKLYSDFDADITIRSSKAKTFNQNFIDIAEIQELPEVNHTIRALEEVVILKHEKKWVHAKMLGVDSSFITASRMKDHLVDGDASLYINREPQAIFGAYLLNKLDAYVSSSSAIPEEIYINVPLREGKLRPGKNPLNTRKVSVGARMNYNREVNDEYLIVPYELANELLEYGDDVTAYYVDLKEGADLSKVKTEMQDILGPDFTVKTSFEKNELIYKTSQSERLIVYLILVFIFILSSFNLIASIVMLFVEKKEDISTLFSLGAERKVILRIFFYEGIMIVGRGVFFGLFLGYLVCFAQMQFGIIGMPSAPGEYFPIITTISDGVFIFFSLGILGLIISYLPVKILINRNYRLKMK
jgi:lipoprotein-releasing system permease protein